MNWNDLRFFVAVAEEGTLSGAARRLSKDHTTVARRIEALKPIWARICLTVWQPGGN
ncbi:LysR family transcriptional regulator [Thalassospira lucentensis]|uniref:LysR family transcriptional regulator n=1 Tax=Thalassospira lucentensis TaxID=168935 RepID=UPI0023F79E24|nr:LysR family transcriptional regulator [Thalassospira lucentensis]